jgi:hypothetical protein
MTTFNATENFTNIDNTNFDSGVILSDRAYLAYGLEESSGIVLNDIGVAGVAGVRDANLSRIDGAIAGRYATQGDGTHFCTIPWNAKYRNNFTWDMWIKIAAADTSSDKGILGGYTSATGRRMFAFAYRSNRVNVLYSNDGSTATQFSTAGALTPDTWYHLRLSYGSAAGMVLSINGSQSVAGSYIGDLLNLNEEFLIFDLGFTGALAGALADVRFYDSVLPATYTVPTAYYKNTGTSLVNDSGQLYMDAGLAFDWDNDTFEETTSGTVTVEYQYADYADLQSWATANDVNDNADWSGSWLSIAQLQAIPNTSKRYRYLKIRITNYGSVTAIEAEKHATDVTPPTGVSGLANIALGTTVFDLITTCDNGTDTGGSLFAGTNFEIEVDGVSYFQHDDGSFLADETFANLLLKGESEEHIIVYALEYEEIPTRFRLNSWDNAQNVARGDWHTFNEVVDPDYILSSAGGNYDDTNLITANVKLAVEYGVDETGTYDNATNPNYVLSSQGGNYVDTNLIPENVKLDVEYGIDETGTYDPSGEPPSQPTLSLTDSGDGVHATATVSGSDTGTTNNIYTAKYGTTAWTLSGTRTGNGTVTLTLDNGSYWAYCDSSLESCSSRSITAIVHIANLDEAVIVDIAEYIKDEINNSDISDVAERNYIQHERLEKITGTEIWVQPNEHRIERATRTKDQHEYDIDVSLFKRCKTTAETDDLVLLSEEIYQFLRSLEINGSLPSVVTMPTMFSPDDLLEHNLFAAVITVTVKAIS